MIKKIFLTALIFGLLSLQAASSAQNLLKNGGFEAGFSYWEADDDSTFSLISDSFEGNRALEYENGGISQSIENLDLDKNLSIVLSGYYKNTGVIDGMWIGVSYSDSSWKNIGESSIQLLPSSSYQPFALVSKPPKNSAHMTVWTWSDSSFGGKTALDDLKLRQESQNSANHIPTIKKIQNQKTLLGESVTLQIEADDLDNDKLIYAVNGFDDDSGIRLDAKTGKISGEALKKGTYDIEVFAIDSKGGVGKTAFIWTIDSEPLTACNIFQNAGFEKSFRGWSVYSAKSELVQDAYKGKKALSIKDGGIDQLSQKLPSKAATYQFNGYYKTDTKVEGLWVGVILYDEDYNLISSKSISLKPSSTYKNFVVNFTTTKETAYIQGWVWSDAGINKGSVLLDELKLSTAECYNYAIASSLPPKGIDISKAPQFVVIGFDDNTKSEGIDWALNFFKNKKNADKSEARVTFYMNTYGLDEWIEDDPAKLLLSIKNLVNSSHEVANHTKNHHSDIKAKSWEEYIAKIIDLNSTQWSERISDASNDLANKAGLDLANMKGFRAPYLAYNQSMLETLKAQNFLYDCSIEEGYASVYDGTNFRWPYQLNEGSPGHNESWYGNPENNESVTVSSIKGLWELPNHVFMVPKNRECEKYGIKKGLWQRIVKKLPYLEGHKITGFDYNLWSEAGLNKDEVLGILKYNLDLRLKGNRAPLMIGAHTQYYTDEWADNNAPNADSSQMREAIEEFVKYALSKPEVRIRPARDIISWCKKPTALP